MTHQSTHFKSVSNWSSQRIQWLGSGHGSEAEHMLGIQRFNPQHLQVKGPAWGDVIFFKKKFDLFCWTYIPPSPTSSLYLRLWRTPDFDGPRIWLIEGFLSEESNVFACTFWSSPKVPPPPVPWGQEQHKEELEACHRRGKLMKTALLVHAEVIDRIQPPPK